MNTVAMAHSDLDDRIAAAFGDGANSRDVAALIKETERTVVCCVEAAERARRHALDPTLSAEEVADARRQMEDAAFRRERLQMAAARLRERLAEVKALEEDQRRQAVYDRVETERDRLAAELADLYPDFAQRLAELLPRIAANDREIAYLNTQLPSGCDRLRGAELAARNLDGFVRNGLATPSVVNELVLPSFEPGAPLRYLWPPTR